MSLSDDDIDRIAAAVAIKLRSGSGSPAGIAAPVEGDQCDDDPYLVPPSAVTKGGFIYFARCHSPDRQIKIGVSRDVGHRMSALRNGCPYPITLLGWYWHAEPLVEEDRLFRQFAEHRLQGEWFAPSKKLIDLVTMIHELRVNAVANHLRATT